jgi:hypothetical protein
MLPARHNYEGGNAPRLGKEPQVSISINSFICSDSESCGISIFNRHLKTELGSLKIELVENNLRSGNTWNNSLDSIIHYAPSAFSEKGDSSSLLRVFDSIDKNKKIYVILHGIHRFGENRFGDNPRSFDQTNHITRMLNKAHTIIALSGSAFSVCKGWQERLGGAARVVRSDHPGLYVNEKLRLSNDVYAFIGGISRSKKICISDPILKLIESCESSGIRVWQHWANLKTLPTQCRSWKVTSGLVDDARWSSLVSDAQVILCPYSSKIQTVSGLISEAISVGRPVLTTSFDFALEMKERFPNLIYVEDDLNNWSELIREFPILSGSQSNNIPTWRVFSQRMAAEFRESETLKEIFSGSLK